MIYTIFHNRYALYNKLPRINKKKLQEVTKMTIFQIKLLSWFMNIGLR